MDKPTAYSYKDGPPERRLHTEPGDQNPNTTHSAEPTSQGPQQSSLVWPGIAQSGSPVSPLARSRPKARLDSGASGFAYGDEVQQKLSIINGTVNKMTKEQLQAKLAHLRLNSCGSKDVLKKRLKNHYKRQRLAQSQKPSSEEKMKYNYLIVIDYEATCSETNENFVHEIIEFPAVLIDTQNMAVCNVFQRFCKPKVNPVLTQFCTELTGISQQQVDKSKDFREVFAEFEEWMSIHGLGTEHKFAVLTDGPWDMARFLKTQTEISGIDFPHWAKQWINLRKAYSAFYGIGRVNLQHMLDELGMKFQGRPHCGLDDARNIANIAIRLLQDGCVMRINEYYHEDNGGPARNGFPPRSGRADAQRSPVKSRLTQVNNSIGGASISSPPDIPQEGEDVTDLMEYLRIQRS